MANRSLIAAGSSIVVLGAIGLLIADPSQLLSENSTGSTLSPCSKEDTLFADVPFVLKPGDTIPEDILNNSIACMKEALQIVNENSEFEAEKSVHEQKDLIAVWPEVYHHCTARVIEAHLDITQDTNPTERPAVHCTEEEYQQVLPPSGVLRELLLSLPPWQVQPGELFGPAIETEVSEADMGPGLLEFLRIYECALLEQTEVLGLPSLTEEIDIPTVATQAPQEQKIIGEELASARVALQRTLTVISGINRLRPLQTELDCLERASTEIRNGLGLLSETLSCVGRALDVRGSLHDIE